MGDDIYDISGSLCNYKGGFGSAKKENIMDLGCDRLEQQIFPFDSEWVHRGKPGAQDFLSERQRWYSKKRDFVMAKQNPREALPVNPLDDRNINEIPMWDPQLIDVSIPEDYEAHKAVSLVQTSHFNHMKQSTLFTDPKLIGDTSINSEKKGQDQKPLQENQKYSMDGSAAGLVSNHFDDDGYRTNSVDATSAF